MKDGELLSLIRRNRDKGMDCLIKEYSKLLYSVVNPRLERVASETEIDDTVRDSFCDFYLSVDRIDLTKGTVKAYLCAIARNKAVKLYLEKNKSVSEISPDGENFASDFSIEEEYVTEETRSAVIKAVKELGKPDSEIIFRKFYFGEESKSIAARLGMTVSNVDTRTHRALKKLKEIFSKGDKTI